jgi:hypothetical protein
MATAIDSEHRLPAFSLHARNILALAIASAAVVLAGCRAATPGASAPQGSGTTRTTAAAIGDRPRVERLLLAEQGTIAMVMRGGCAATMKTSDSATGAQDELRVRCPKPERLRAWFDTTERLLAEFTLEPIPESPDGDDGPATETKPKLPLAKVLTKAGTTLRLAREDEVKKLATAVHALTAELASAESPAPGPATPAGWQMLHVVGPAHVLFAGTPARGAFEARMSTNGQYLCEFRTDVGDGPMRATKSGWLSPATAARAIDEVLAPFAAASPGERAKSTYAAGTRAGTESASNTGSTAAVFARFATVQDALGDACLPELEPPPAGSIGL